MSVARRMAALVTAGAMVGAIAVGVVSLGMTEHHRSSADASTGTATGKRQHQPMLASGNRQDQPSTTF